jgi:hypothetical protein
MHFAGLGTTAYGVALSQATLTNQINSFRPVGIRWGWDTGGGHILAVKGVAGNTVYLMDPWNGDIEISSYNWVVRSVSDGHTWTDSLTIGNNPPSIIPIIDSPFSYSFTTTKATVGATIESDGAVLLTASGVAYGKNAYPTISGAKKKTAPTITTGSFSVGLKGLAKNTIYHYRGYATNIAGTAYTADTNFTTVSGAPKSTAATTITASAFTAHWNPPSGTGFINYYNLDVATNAAFTNVIQHVSIVGTSFPVTVPAKGKYYYRVNAVNAGGTSAYSAKKAVTVH